MRHPAVKIDRISCAQTQGCIEFAVQLQLSANHENKFFAVMPMEFARLLERTSFDLAYDRRKLLIGKIDAEIAQGLHGRIENLSVTCSVDAPPRSLDGFGVAHLTGQDFSHVV